MHMGSDLPLVTAAAKESFELGLTVGLIIGIPIALWVGYKLARKLKLF